MDLLKYIIAAAVAFVISIITWIMGNFLSGLLIFILLFGGYIMWNVFESIRNEPIPEKKEENLPQDN